jgi:uncharacterized repeat protein (TIGR03803 family)
MSGGMYGGGTFFRFSTSRVITTLHSFSGGDDGASPQGGLVLASDGNFYGSAQTGGTNPVGIIFRTTPSGVVSRLYTFHGTSDGGSASYGFIQGSDGSFYGITIGGGTSNKGTIFKLTTDGVLTTLYSFTGGGDGRNPIGRLTQGSDGNFYGTTVGGGSTNDYGTVFRFSPDGVFTSLYWFRGNNDSMFPHTGLVQGDDGNFYGTTHGYGYGIVFMITTHGDFTTLHSFTGGVDGEAPEYELVPGPDGGLYGTTCDAPTYHGTVFKISTNGVYAHLHAFQTFEEGTGPNSRLVLASDGKLYGTTSYGGSSNVGMVFKLSTDGAFTNLHSFNKSDGGWPETGLVQGIDGYLYGTTFNGGSNGYGTYFKVSTNGEFTSLYSVTRGDGGSNPIYELVQGKNGNLYGLNPYAGAYGKGNIFRITTNGVFKSIYSFTGGTNGANPRGTLVQGDDGAFYGTTENGGAYGTVFRASIMPAFQTALLSNNTLALAWSAEPGSSYQLQYKSDLNSGNWIDLGNAMTATGDTLTSTDSVPNDPHRFYRVLVLSQ